LLRRLLRLMNWLWRALRVLVTALLTLGLLLVLTWAGALLVASISAAPAATTAATAAAALALFAFLGLGGAGLRGFAGQFRIVNFDRVEILFDLRLGFWGRRGFVTHVNISVGLDLPDYEVVLGLLGRGKIGGVDVGAGGVVGVEADAVHRDCFAHADVHVFAVDALGAREELALGAEQFAGDARGDDHFDLGDSLRVEDRGHVAEGVGGD
jgi:hypothetical protein